MAAPFIYIGTFRIKPGHRETARRRLAEHVDFVETNEPRLIAFNVYLDEAADRVSVVQVHPDSASMEFHMQVSADHIAGAFDFLDKVVSQQYYGEVSENLAAQLAKWATQDVAVTNMPVHEGGFTRSAVR